MRVVLDTNIFISALLGGRLGILVDEWKAQKFTLIVSTAIAHEYMDVINRPKFKIPAREITTTTNYLLKNAEFVTPLTTVTVVKSDTFGQYISRSRAGRKSGLHRQRRCAFAGTGQLWQHSHSRP